MATIQKSFSYEGDPSKAPFKTINLEFNFPVFEFVSSHDKKEINISRNEIAVEKITVQQKLTEAKYTATIPGKNLIGDTENSGVNFLRYLSKIGFENDDKDLLDSLTVQFTVNICDESENLFGYCALNALYTAATASDKYRKIIAGIKKAMSAKEVNKEKLKKLELQLVDYLKENILLVNKNVFTEVAAECRNLVPSHNDYAFLFILGQLTEVANGKPVFKYNVQEFTAFLNENFKDKSRNIVRDVLPVLKENFDKLFDFPISAPEVKMIDIKGTFKIATTDASPVSASDFNFYNLAVEYAVKTNNGNVQAAAQQFNWNTVPDATLNTGTAPVSFVPVITNFIESEIVVRVKNYVGVVIWNKSFIASDTSLQALKIVVPLERPVVITDDYTTEPVKGDIKLHGKIVSLEEKCPLKGVNVIVHAKKSGEQNFNIVGVATADSSGNFSLPYPYGVFTAAQAYVSLTPDSPANILVYADADHVSRNETIANDFLYLLIKDVDCDCKDEDDCNCHEPKKSNRLPDQEELIKSDDYTQDIGGACINLSVPNRTISEYRHKAVVRTSDPDIANYTLSKDAKGNFVFSGGLSKIERKPVDLSNPIYWEDSPASHKNLSFYQAVTVATGHVLHYSVSMRADGYSLGELLYSLPLAPGQKKEIVVFDQTHTLLGSETQSISQFESLAASLINDISIADSLGGTINESTSGRSSASTGGMSGGLGLAGIVQGIAGALGIAGGFSNAGSSASQNNSRDVTEYFLEQIRNGISQNAQSYRELNASVVTTIKEGQQYGVTSEVVANHNHCHSLTMMYFEVLKHYAIYRDLAYVEECLFIPLLMTHFSYGNIYKWKDVLAVNLKPLPSDTYLQPYTALGKGRLHPLLKAFDALDRKATNYENVDFPDAAYCDDVITSVTGVITFKVEIPRPKSIFDSILDFGKVKKAENLYVQGTTVWEAIIDIAIGESNAGKPWSEKIRLASSQIIIYDNFEEAKPADVIEVVNFNNFFRNNVDEKLWKAIAALCGYSDVTEFLKGYFAHKTISKWEQVFNEEIAPKVFESITNEHINIYPFGNIDFTYLSKYHGGVKTMKVNFRSHINNTRRNITNLSPEYIETIPNPNDFWAFATLAIETLNINYTTKHYKGVIINQYIGDDIREFYAESIPVPMNSDEQRNPRKEDNYIITKLLEHLNSNLEYYNKVLWTNLDADRRYMLLDGFNIETYNDFGQPIGFRSLASVVKNELVGIAGNSLIMPVAPGYKIDLSYIVEKPIEGEAVHVSLFDHYKPLTPIPPYRVSVPGKGVFAEAVMGACDACEKVKENTSQDWDKFKTDEPTPINPVTTPVPTVTDWKAAFKDFATPVVNIQNAPAAPTPGAGLAGLSDLLGKSDVFKDITGLEGNQKNAMQTYLSNQQNAKDFAQMAKDIFTMDNNTKHSDAIAESIRNSDELSDAEKADLLKKHFNQVIDSGQSEKAAQEAAQNNKPTLTDAAVKAADEGRVVKGSTSDANGNTESVEIGPGDNKKDFRVVGTVNWVSQDGNANACWAAAATMMKGWKDNKKYTIPQVLALTPEKYLQKYNANQPLLAAEKQEFIESLHMTGEPPASYTFDTFVGWMKQYGPLWVTVDSNTEPTVIAPHAKILIGYDGDGTQENSKLVFYDPAISGEQRETFEQFLVEYEAMVDPNRDELFIQVVHFKDSILGEGGAQTPTYWKRANPISTWRENNIAKEAIAKLRYFAAGNNIATPAWTKLNKPNLFLRLEAIVKDPSIIDQKNSTFCGSASFFRIWIELDPESFVDFAIKIYRDGNTNLGTENYNCYHAFLTTDFSTIAAKNGIVGLSEAEWMICSTIEEITMDTSLVLDLKRYTNAKEMVTYLNGIDYLFSHVDFEKLSIKEINDKLKANGDKMDVAMLHHYEILPTGTHKMTVNGHWSVLYSEFYNVNGNTTNYLFDYWCYGKLNSQSSGASASITEDEFNERIWGFAVCERKETFWYELFGGQLASEITIGGDDTIYVLEDTLAPGGGYKIFKYSSAWSLLDNTITALKIAGLPGKELLIIDINGEIAKYDGSGAWTKLTNQLPTTTGIALEIAASVNGTVYALGDEAISGGHPIFKLEGGSWTQIAGAATRIAVDKEGNPWAISDAEENNLFEWDPTTEGDNKWEIHDVKAEEISVFDRRHIVFSDSQNKILRLRSFDNTDDLGGLAKKMCTNKSGLLYVIGTDNKIYTRKPILPKTTI